MRAPKVALYPDRKAIQLRASERPTQPSRQKPCHSERLYREESAVAASSPALTPNSHCGNHLEILWEASIDGIHSAPVCLLSFEDSRFRLTATPPGLNSRRLGGPRFGL